MNFLKKNKVLILIVIIFLIIVRFGLIGDAYFLYNNHIITPITHCGYRDVIATKDTTYMGIYHLEPGIEVDNNFACIQNENQEEAVYENIDNYNIVPSKFDKDYTKLPVNINVSTTILVKESITVDFSNLKDGEKVTFEISHKSRKEGSYLSKEFTNKSEPYTLEMDDHGLLDITFYSALTETEETGRLYEIINPEGYIVIQ